MSEKSLQDFFAKKDKSKKNKKSKGKTKFTTTDGIAKKLTEGEAKKDAAKKQEPKKEKEKKPEIPATEDGEEPPKTAKIYPIVGDDEWNEFEDPNEKDYSGLKVQSLQISTEQEDTAEEEDDGDGELDENGDPIKTKGSGMSGPWNKSTATPVPAGTPTDPEPAPEPKPKPEPVKSVSGGKYVPPSRRAAAAMSSESGSSSRYGRQKTGKNVPQIESDLEFPSLAASSDIAKYSDKNDDKHFQEVRKGGLATDNPAGNRPRLELENRYAALGN